MKILKLLSAGNQVTPTQIAKLVRVSYDNVTSHLEILEAEGILKHVNFGKRIKFYKYDETSPVAHALKDLIEVFENAQG